ncbi:beta-1,4-galactosyltransferase 2-like [Babylonia areolata]|uniref:beta-1,4-galactosyltransferase 2-like n=1 Tax=Babylonia areolata TaxID=304850 RepID=UPI003FD37702
MRSALKITLVLFVGLVIVQAYFNFGSLLVSTRYKARASDEIAITLAVEKVRFRFSVPKLKQNSTSPMLEQADGSPSFHNDSVSSSSSSSSSSSLLQNNSQQHFSSAGTEALPSSMPANGDILKSQSSSNYTQADRSQQPRDAVLAQDENVTSFVHDDDRLKEAGRQTLGGNVTVNELHRSLSLTVAEPRSDAGSPQESGRWSRADELVREGGKLLLSNASGDVRLPVVTSGSAVDSALPSCPGQPPGLEGNVTPPFLHPVEVPALEQHFSFMSPGGDYRPPDCRPQQRVAVIIPYRNRWAHLHVLLNNLIPFLVRQQASFTIFVIDQAPPSTFNRALLLNIGVLEASLRDLYTCFIFHDVDLIPLNDRNLYRCGEQPKHFAVGINKFMYRLPYPGYFGGVTGLSREQLEKINGNSNLYFGWGGEDDELLYRVRARGMTVARDPPQIGRYDMFRHGRDRGNEANPFRFHMLKTARQRMQKDGLTSLSYSITSVHLGRLYTWIRVKVDPRHLTQNLPPYIRVLLGMSLKADQPPDQQTQHTQ